MAKNNNLTDFLTGVADAIRTKKGTSDLINPQDFESEISSIAGKVLAHTATFTVDGSNYAIHSVTDGQSIVSPTSPSKTGYAFKGWQDSNGNAVSFPYTMSASEETLTADFLHLKLATPQNVTASGTTVSWDAVENATSYAVLADGSEIGTVIGEST